MLVLFVILTQHVHIGAVGDADELDASTLLAYAYLRLAEAGCAEAFGKHRGKDFADCSSCRSAWTALRRECLDPENVLVLQRSASMVEN